MPLYKYHRYKRSEMHEYLPPKRSAFGGAEKGYCGKGIRAPRRGAI
ncbi:hypothetical protein C5S36_07810 [Candidatus Methanophagaceae archaeon]|nr:hypothetical protein C5S36_07810 [Methanophagales archaeon]